MVYSLEILILKIFVRGGAAAACVLAVSFIEQTQDEAKRRLGPSVAQLTLSAEQLR